MLSFLPQYEYLVLLIKQARNNFLNKVVVTYNFCNIFFCFLYVLIYIGSCVFVFVFISFHQGIVEPTLHQERSPLEKVFIILSNQH